MAGFTAFSTTDVNALGLRPTPQFPRNGMVRSIGLSRRAQLATASVHWRFTCAYTGTVHQYWYLQLHAAVLQGQARAVPRAKESGDAVPTAFWRPPLVPGRRPSREQH